MLCGPLGTQGPFPSKKIQVREQVEEKESLEPQLPRWGGRRWGATG